MKTKVPLKRRVREEYRAGDQIGFVTKSFSKDDGTKYKPTIDTTTGESHCDCASSVYRPHAICKHRLRAALQLIRKGELDATWLQRAGKKCCHRCGAEQGLYGFAHADGTPHHDVWICSECAGELEREHSPKRQSELECYLDAVQSDIEAKQAELARWIGNQVSLKPIFGLDYTEEIGSCEGSLRQLNQQRQWFLGALEAFH